MVDRIDPIEDANRKKKTGMSEGAQSAIMMAAMNRANPNQDATASHNVANASQSVSNISESSNRETVNANNQQVESANGPTNVAEAKASGLAVGTKIEQPDSLEKQRSDQDLLTGSSDPMALDNRNDLINKKKIM